MLCSHPLYLVMLCDDFEKIIAQMVCYLLRRFWLTAGLPKDLTTEYTEATEKQNLCVLRDLCGDVFCNMGFHVCRA